MQNSPSHSPAVDVHRLRAAVVVIENVSGLLLVEMFHPRNYQPG